MGSLSEIAGHIEERVQALGIAEPSSFDCVPAPPGDEQYDVAFNTAIELAGRLRVDPNQLARSIVGDSKFPWVENIEVIRGHLNLRLTSAGLLAIDEHDLPSKLRQVSVVAVQPATDSPEAQIRLVSHAVLNVLLCRVLCADSLLERLVGSELQRISDLGAAFSPSVSVVPARSLSLRETVESIVEVGSSRHSVIWMRGAEFSSQEWRAAAEVPGFFELCALRFCDPKKLAPLDPIPAWFVPMVSHNTGVLRAALYLSSDLPADEIEWEVLRLHERGNLGWYLGRVLEMLDRHGCDPRPLSRLSNLEESRQETIGMVRLIKLFHLRLVRAAFQGEIENVVDSLQRLTAGTVDILNDPRHRYGKNNTPNQSEILAGVAFLLSAMMRI